MRGQNLQLTVQLEKSVSHFKSITTNKFSGLLNLFLMTFYCILSQWIKHISTILWGMGESGKSATYHIKWWWWYTNAHQSVTPFQSTSWL